MKKSTVSFKKLKAVFMVNQVGDACCGCNIFC